MRSSRELDDVQIKNTTKLAKVFKVRKHGAGLREEVLLLTGCACVCASSFTATACKPT